MKVSRSSGNVFSDIGLEEVEAVELAAKADLVALLMRVIRRRALTQVQAARLCGVDQPTLSKVLSGKLESITIDRLARWIVALGGRVRITVGPPTQRRGRYKGSMRVEAAL